MLRIFQSYIHDESGAVTIEWVMLTAGVIALGIAGYGAFKIDLDSSVIPADKHSNGGTVVAIKGGNAMTRLLKTVELELKMFRACNFASAGEQFSVGSNQTACSFRETGPTGPTEPSPPLVGPEPLIHN